MRYTLVCGDALEKITEERNYEAKSKTERRKAKIPRETKQSGRGSILLIEMPLSTPLSKEKRKDTVDHGAKVSLKVMHVFPSRSDGTKIQPLGAEGNKNPHFLPNPKNFFILASTSPPPPFFFPSAFSG